MNRRHIALLVGLLSVAGGCDKYLDVNTNPNAPQQVAANLYLPPLVHWMATSPAFDGRFTGQYTQMFHRSTTTLTNWARMGYDRTSDNGGQQWRDVYWTFGQNLVDMINIAEKEQRWDLLGVGYILKGWGWESVTDMHGEIILKEAFDQTRYNFDYDLQQDVYPEIQRLYGEAIKNLQKTDGAVDATYLAKGDKMYNGDRTKWLKLAYGLMAINLNHYSNKASYKPADVIANVDKSFTSNADDALFTYPGASVDLTDYNFLGPTRCNFSDYRQTQFIVNLMNGTQFGGSVDPRMKAMLEPSPDGQFRGLDINLTGFSGLNATTAPMNFYNQTTSSCPKAPGRYLFSDKAKYPIVTYSQLQFIKAEAAYKMGDKATALAAYRNAISSHIDFVNARNLDEAQPAPQITAAEKAAFLADPNIVPTDPNKLTLSMIMSQKFIAQWAWGFDEAWMDMRRYHYTDTDPASGKQVFLGFTPPTNLDVDNQGKLVQRMRPRYNSEYVWNQKGLDQVGGLATDYQTKPMWIIQP